LIAKYDTDGNGKIDIPEQAQPDVTLERRLGLVDRQTLSQVGARVRAWLSL